MGEANRLPPFSLEKTMSEINEKYTSYVHISNSGYSFSTEVRDVDSKYGATQHLGIELHAFGLPMSTEVWLDDNTLEALEYILAKAREQRAAFKMTGYNPTNPATPPNTRESGESCDDRNQSS